MEILHEIASTTWVGWFPTLAKNSMSELSSSYLSWWFQNIVQLGYPERCHNHCFNTNYFMLHYFLFSQDHFKILNGLIQCLILTMHLMTYHIFSGGPPFGTLDDLYSYWFVGWFVVDNNLLLWQNRLSVA